MSQNKNILKCFQESVDGIRNNDALRFNVKNSNKICNIDHYRRKKTVEEKGKI